jgi:potassium/hydrogen antiporter
VSDAELILVGATLLAAGIAAAMVADRLRVPGLVLFLGLGMLIGEEGFGGVEFDDAELTRTLGTIGLVLILFEGGLTAGWKEIRPVLGTAVALATIGTLLTSVVAGVGAMLLFDLDLLEGLIIGAAVAATDSAAIFAVLRGSTLRKRLARSLEGESGMNDPIALLLVTGFIAWIQEPGYGIVDMGLEFVIEISVGTVIGLGVGFLSRLAFRELDYPTAGLYPVASIATVGLAYGVADVAHGSGFLAVYLAGLVLGTGVLPARRTITAFHQGLSWVSQISLFFLLGLLVVPSELGDVALEGIALALVVMLVARPLATGVATLFAPFRLSERMMLSWAGMRGAVPIWLATIPVTAGIAVGDFAFDIIFFVVVLSTLIQGTTFEPLADRLGLTTNEPALPQSLVETGIIQELGGDTFAYRVDVNDAAVGRQVKELGLPRDALVNLIVRAGEALPPRGSTVIEAGDELHFLIRREARDQVGDLTQLWKEGPLGHKPLSELGVRGSPQIFKVRPASDSDGDTGNPQSVDDVQVARILRTRSDRAAAIVALMDGRFAVTGPDVIALGGRRALARWCVERADRDATSPQDRSWWQEAVGVLNTAALR